MKQICASACASKANSLLLCQWDQLWVIPAVRYPSHGLSQQWVIPAARYPSSGLSQPWVIPAAGQPSSCCALQHPNTCRGGAGVAAGRWARSRGFPRQGLPRVPSAGTGAGTAKPGTSHGEFGRRPYPARKSPHWCGREAAGHWCSRYLPYPTSQEVRGFWNGILVCGVSLWWPLGVFLSPVLKKKMNQMWFARRLLFYRSDFAHCSSACLLAVMMATSGTSSTKPAWRRRGQGRWAHPVGSAPPGDRRAPQRSQGSPSPGGCCGETLSSPRQGATRRLREGRQPQILTRQGLQPAGRLHLGLLWKHRQKLAGKKIRNQCSSGATHLCPNLTGKLKPEAKTDPNLQECKGKWL